MTGSRRGRVRPHNWDQLSEVDRAWIDAEAAKVAGPWPEENLRRLAVLLGLRPAVLPTERQPDHQPGHQPGHQSGHQSDPAA